ncbi:MAG TPA: hypothetical protein VFV85_04435 [Conexibacter sp.]|nr:hypothetical protein [Conexibacter sp.]
MRPRHPLPLACALALALGCASGTAATRGATLTTDARCYAQGAPLRLTAGGLAPEAPLVVSLDGQALSYRDGSSPETDSAGTFASSFATPALAPGVAQARHLLSVSDGRRRPRARFTVTRPTGAAFQPASGDPRSLRARFSVWGFALAGGDARVRVWLHWVDPAGRVQANAALGTTGGDCGTLTTPPRRVFPFAPRAGRWTLVLDGQRRYRVQTDGPRAKIPVHVRSLAR